MSGEATVHAEIYLFEIVQPEKGFAKFGNLYKRLNVTRKQALDEVCMGSPPTGWRRATGHKAGGLNMTFSPRTQALVIVRISSTGATIIETVFGDKVAVDLDVQGSRCFECIKRCDRYDCGGGDYKLCAFEIDIPSVLEDAKVELFHHPITRFPIMFDFVDSDGVSPVFRGPHKNATLATKGRGHGGIHPRGGSSLIVIE